MKYAVIKVSNGNFSIESEWSAIDKAIVNFHSICTTLWNAQDVEHATVEIVDEKLRCQKVEYIKYDEQA